MAKEVKGLKAMLGDGDRVIVAEGYLFEFERRGYLKAGAFVPEVVIEHPNLVRNLYEEFVHAGSDVVEAFTYYAHREKLRVIGRDSELEAINRKALKIAREVANETGTLMAGNICNTTIYRPDSEEVHNRIRQMFKEQIQWAVQEGADFIIGETFSDYGEAKLAVECIQEHGNGLPAVITMAPTKSGSSNDGIPMPEVCKKLEEDGAACVGINCMRGPDTMLPLIREVRAACSGPIACLPVPYRTNDSMMSMVNLIDPITGEKSFPCDLDAWLCSKTSIERLTKDLLDIGVQYIGLCCGSRAYMIRAMAEAIGRKPPASRYTADMSLHYSRLADESHSYSGNGFTANR